MADTATLHWVVRSPWKWDPSSRKVTPGSDLSTTIALTLTLHLILWRCTQRAKNIDVRICPQGMGAPLVNFGRKTWDAASRAVCRRFGRYKLSRLYERSIEGLKFLSLRSEIISDKPPVSFAAPADLGFLSFIIWSLCHSRFSQGRCDQAGDSLWLGVIHENPSTEPRILTEVIEAWERSIQRQKGLFDPSFG